MLDFKAQTNKQRLGYNPAQDRGKKTICISESPLAKYQGQSKEWESNEVKKPGFEIFVDVITTMGKSKNQEEEEITIAQVEQVLKNTRLEAKTVSYAKIAAFIESSINDVLFDDVSISTDVCTASLFESNDVLNAKFNVMKSNFA